MREPVEKLVDADAHRPPVALLVKAFQSALKLGLQELSPGNAIVKNTKKKTETMMTTRKKKRGKMKKKTPEKMKKGK